MDLSHSGPSRDAEGRHPAAHPGLGPRVGARVASPRGPILRPGPSSLLRLTSGGQFTPGAGSMIRRGTVTSAAPALQQVIDGEVLLHQGQAAPQGVGRLLGRQALESAVADAVVLAE